jgi:hypothetical protein
MIKMFVKQKVSDVTIWRRVFGEMEAARQSYGLHLTGMYLSTEPSTIIVTLDCDDLAGAKAFASSDVLIAARKKAGALGEADYWIATGSIA